MRSVSDEEMAITERSLIAALIEASPDWLAAAQMAMAASAHIIWLAGEQGGMKEGTTTRDVFGIIAADVEKQIFGGTTQ